MPAGRSYRVKSWMILKGFTGIWRSLRNHSNSMTSWQRRTVNLFDEKVEGHTEGHWKALTKEEAEELAESSTKEEDEEETEAEPATRTLLKFAKEFHIAQTF